MQGAGDQQQEFYKGYIVAMEIDPRDAAFKFEASVINENTIVVTAPALDFHDLGGDKDLDRVAIMTKENDLRQDNTVIQEAYVHGRNDFKSRNIENKIHYHLTFTGNVLLSSEVLRVHEGKRGKMLLEGFSVYCDLPNFSGPYEWLDERGNPMVDDQGLQIMLMYQFYRGTILWRVANTASSTRKHDTGTREDTPTDAFSALFGNMNV
ncbi:MAG: hypothetical protein ACRCZI_04860, partial [Cetobacterium sp.]